MAKNKDPWLDYLNGFQDPNDRARAMIGSGIDCPENMSIVYNLAALRGPYNQLLAATHAPPKNRQQRRAEKRAQKLYDRARARPQFAHLYGDASLAPGVSRNRDNRDCPQDLGAANNADIHLAAAGRVVTPVETPAARSAPPKASPTNSPFGAAAHRSAELVKRPTSSPDLPSYDRALASGLYEAEVRRAEAFGWEPPERPDWYVPCPPAQGPNPFAKIPPRGPVASTLRGRQTMRLFDAISFAMWQFGQPLNVHVVILWETFGVHDHEAAARHLGVILNRASKWAEVGTPGEMRWRRRQRTGDGFPLLWVYVHENAPGRGFHSHVLMSMPTKVVPAFREWLWSALQQRTRNRGDQRSLRVIAPSARDEGVAVRRTWGWFRYIVKQTDPNAAIADTPDAPLRPLREVLKPWGFRTALPVSCAKLCGCSQNIGMKAQSETAFRSELRAGDLTRIYSGWEMEDGRQARLMQEMLPTLAL